MPNITELRAAVARLMYSDNRDIADYNTLIAFIDRMDRLMRMLRWIPVTERLPKDARKVLLYTNHGAVYRGYYDHVHKCWRTTNTVKVTHWRPPDRPEDWE